MRKSESDRKREEERGPFAGLVNHLVDQMEKDQKERAQKSKKAQKELIEFLSNVRVQGSQG